jgi:multisubunit Na+/H+ antiporter MnhC subunit
MEKFLDVAACVLAFVAAVFWFLSAYESPPPMVTYWGGAPLSDPLHQALVLSARMNTFAAAFSGLSALCMAAKLFKHS